MIDWLSEKSEILLNSRLSRELCDKARASLPLEGDFRKHFWLATSGSTADVGDMKFVALSKEAILASAEAVNKHLNLTEKDVWINPLPGFHVGGLGIYARAYLNGAKVVVHDAKWNPHTFVEVVTASRGTISALVPTQVFDLVSAELQAPGSLKAVIVGGGKLPGALYHRARVLGWKLLPSYGLTEASSQVATAIIATEEFPSIQALSHLEVAVSNEGYFMLKGPSLLSCYAYLSQVGCRIHDPKVDGWLTTEDKGMIEGRTVTLFGRDSDFYKIGGENVNMKSLEEISEAIKLNRNLKVDVALVAMEDSRLGHAIHLAVGGEPDPQIQRFVECYQLEVLPFERIKKVHYLPELPRSPLNKLLVGRLKELLKE